MLVAPDEKRAELAYRQLRFFAPNAETLYFPAWDCLPYDRASPSANVVGRRIKVLLRLGEKVAPDFIVTSTQAAAQRTPPVGAFVGRDFLVKTGQKLNRDALITFLIENGYRRDPSAYEGGEYAVRGGVIDVLPPGSEAGVRIDCFGDAIESLRVFDPTTQTSTDHIAEYRFFPASELPTDKEGFDRFLRNYRKQFGLPKGHDPLYEHISEGRLLAGAEHWLPMFYDKTSTFFAALPEGTEVIFDAQSDIAFADHIATVKDCCQARWESAMIRREGEENAVSTPVLDAEDVYLTHHDWITYRKRENVVIARQESSESKVEYPIAAQIGEAPNYDKRAEREEASAIFLLKKDVESDRKTRRHVACLSENSRARLAHMLHEADLRAVHVDSFPAARELSPETMALYVLPIENGFVANDYLVLSEQDLLGERFKTNARTRKRAENFLKEAASLMPGDLVVHEDNGLGRFLGLENIEAGDRVRDCLKIEYRDGDLLFVPVEHIGLVSRYGSDDGDALLDKLGRDSWSKRKASVKNRIRDIAARMLKLAGERVLREAPVLTAKPDDYDTFCARFPYVETEDQLRAADEVAHDMACGRAMDRLLCGDVGFGKTEVALRATFIAASGDNPMQVAVVAPTTLLARQHLITFKERFARMNVRIEGLSRLTSPKDAKKIREDVKKGQVDVVVGTHALLAKSIEFNCLGLVVIDEEQLFGVAQKERLKELRGTAHVLSMSATPIPRTLQMSLSGIKDLTLMTTPPTDRLEIRTFVSPLDRVLIKNAVLRERHRGGCCFFVGARIADLPDMQKIIEEVVPESKIAVAHGQMTGKELEEVMEAFYDGAFDILLSTNIVGSGIDMPNANTIMIYGADRFGLSQLYQMRGRVGRGKTRAYAYLFLPEKRRVTEEAQRRLDILHRLDTLGAGFTVASHDMDIRGFGNLLGDEQSGQVREVGVELYQDMLREAIEDIKESGGLEAPEDDLPSFMPDLRLGADLLIPKTYIKETELRMGLYRRIGFAESEEELFELHEEMSDRFGPMPEQTDALLGAAVLRLYCREAGIKKLDAGPKGVTVDFDVRRMKNPVKVVEYAAAHPNEMRAKSGDKFIFPHDPEGDSLRGRLEKALFIASEMAKAQRE